MRSVVVFLTLIAAAPVLGHEAPTPQAQKALRCRRRNIARDLELDARQLEIGLGKEIGTHRAAPLSPASGRYARLRRTTRDFVESRAPESCINRS